MTEPNHPAPAAPPMVPPAPFTAQSFAVIGAGAVGCYFGALLAQAGHPVVLIGRGEHVRAIQNHGLRLQTATQDQHIAVAADTDMARIRHADVVLLCVKATDTEATTVQMQPHLRPGALVLTLQNGVDNDARVRALLGSHCEVAAAVVYVATAMVGPGHVRHFGRGDLVLAPSTATAQVAPVLQAAGIPTQVSEQVRSALWAKLVINCAYNALSAITQQPYGWLVQQADVPELLEALVAECQAVAQADGVTLAPTLLATVQAIARDMAGQRSSTAQDLARGKPSEIAHLNGYVVARGRALGLATPINLTLLVLVRMLEQRNQEAAATAATALP